MRAHSDAFIVYRDLSQAHLDFVVIVCHAMPALRADIALLNSTLTYTPDHFEANRNPKSWVASKVGSYQDELARSTLITSFSYFEAYVRDVLNEMVAFHGGKSAFRARTRKRISRDVVGPSPSIVSAKRKLQDSFDKAKIEKYRKNEAILQKAGFHFPTDLMANFGAKYLVEKLDEKRGMRAWEIPSILSECVLFDLDVRDKNIFEDIRGLRNRIGHGKPPKILLKDSLRFASELHAMAAKIDRHMLENFFVFQDV